MDDLFGGELIEVRPKQVKLPAEITDLELGLRVVKNGDHNAVLANSRSVALVFGKRHDNVLRDIDKLISDSSDLRSLNWFKKSSYINDQGRSYPIYDLTLNGFVCLVFGYEGQYAIDLRVRYILQFNKMEEALAERSHEFVRPIINAINAAITEANMRREESEHRFTGLLNRVLETAEWIQAKLQRQREDPSISDQKTHVVVVFIFFTGRCPCCQRRQILDENGAAVIRENKRILDFDHFKQSSVPDLIHTWPVCADGKDSCHYKLTHGEHSISFRLQVEQAWANYQRRVHEYLDELNAQSEMQLLKPPER